MSSTARGLMGWSRSSSRGSATSSASVVISRFSMTASRVSGKYTSMLGRSRCEGSATQDVLREEDEAPQDATLGQRAAAERLQRGAHGLELGDLYVR